MLFQIQLTVMDWSSRCRYISYWQLATCNLQLATDNWQL